MPVKLGEFDAALQYLQNKLPQLGMFSTLDEAIRNAPQKQMTAEQWQQYLKPGLQTTRAGVNFPLKSEELQYSGLPEFFQKFQNDPSVYNGSIPKEELLSNLHQNRPGFNLRVGLDPNSTVEDVSAKRAALASVAPNAVTKKGIYNEHAYTSGVPGSYEENVTTSPDFGTFKSHFSPQDLSWSRTTRHSVDDQPGTIARLIEEIQSDRHEAAAERVPEPFGGGFTQGERRGYRTPKEDDLVNQGAVNQNFNAKPPDTPFKDPADYAGLELRKQLLNAVNQGDSYLALTRGADQVDRYEQGMGGGKGEGMSYIYDQVYPSALKKLARQYGANVTDIPVSVKSRGNDRPQAFVDFGAENLNDYLDAVRDNVDPISQAESLKDAANQMLVGLNNPDQSLAQSRDAVHRHANSAAAWGQSAIDQSDIGDDDRAALAGEKSTESLGKAYQHLQNLWEAWKNDKTSPANALEQKTFPAMQITPDVIDKVKKAGVPLFTLAGATALGLGNDDANATPVEDASMQNANTYDDGGLVLHPKQSLADALARLAKIQSPGADQEAQKNYLDRARVSVGDPVASQMRARAIIDAEKPTTPVQNSPANTPPVAANTTPTQSFGIPDLVRMARERLSPSDMEASMASGGSVSDESEEQLESNLENMILQQQLSPKQISGYAEGGSSTTHEDDRSQDPDYHSSLKKLSDFLKIHFGPDVQRYGTGVAKQLYGLDKSGEPTFGGGAWTKDQGGTPPALLDSVAALPGNAISILNAIKHLNQATGPSPSGVGTQDIPSPQFSDEASDRLAKLNARVAQTTGVGEPQNLREHFDDAAAMLTSPFPAAKVAEEAPTAQRLLEMIAPLRPPTASRFASDTAGFAGTSAALDALGRRVAKSKPAPPETADTTLEDVAMNNSNQEYAEGGEVASQLAALLGNLKKNSDLRSFRTAHIPINQADLAPEEKHQIAKWMYGDEWPYIESMGSDASGIFDNLTKSYGLQKPTTLFRGIGENEPNLETLRDQLNSFTADPRLAQESYSSGDKGPGNILVYKAPKGTSGLPLRLTRSQPSFSNQDEFLIPRNLKWSLLSDPQTVGDKQYWPVAPQKASSVNTALSPASRSWSLEDFYNSPEGTKPPKFQTSAGPWISTLSQYPLYNDSLMDLAKEKGQSIGMLMDELAAKGRNSTIGQSFSKGSGAAYKELSKMAKAPGAYTPPPPDFSFTDDSTED